MVNFEIRELDFSTPEPAAIEAVEELFVPEVHFKYKPNMAPSELDFKSSFKYCAQQDVTNYGLFNSNEALLAAASIRYNFRKPEEIRGSSNTAAWLQLVAVRPEERNNGYGKALLTHIAAIAVSKGDVQIQGKSSEDEFYEKLGCTVSDSVLNRLAFINLIGPHNESASA